LRNIIFTIRHTGHNLEYLHHIYEYCSNLPDKYFVFLIPSRIKDRMSLLNWPEVNNILFDYISEEKQDYCQTNNKFLNSLRISLLLRKKVKEYNADTIFAITLMSLLPFAGFLVPVKISGIIYKIYLYTWKNESWKSKIADVTKYFLFTKSKQYSKVFILNDAISAKYLNRKWNSRKFLFLPDPFLPIPVMNTFDFRQRYNIPKDFFIFAHFGSIQKRKGTLDVLESIHLIPEEYRKQILIVIAGKVDDNFRDLFYRKFNTLPFQNNVLIIDDFCSYSLFASLCLCSSAILLPYTDTYQSSGMLGYASQFNVPVIGTQDGLLGKLIRRYHLGEVCAMKKPEAIANCYLKVISGETPKPCQTYCREHELADFAISLNSIW